MHVILHEWLCYFNLYLCDHYFGFTPLHKKANKVLQRWLVLAFYRLALFLKSENVVIYHLLFSTNTAFVHVSHLLIFIKRHLHDWLKYQGRNLFWKWNLYIFSMGENPSLLSSMYYFKGIMSTWLRMPSDLSSGALVQTGDSQATTTIKPVANKVQ